MSRGRQAAALFLCTELFFLGAFVGRPYKMTKNPAAAGPIQSDNSIHNDKNAHSMTAAAKMQGKTPVLTA